MTLTCASRYTDEAVKYGIGCQDRHHPEGLHHAHHGSRCIVWVDGDAAAINPASACPRPPVHEVEQRAAELHAKAKAQRARLAAYIATEASDDEVPGLLALADRLRSEEGAQPAPGPCPISPCDWDLEGTLEEHLHGSHETEDLAATIVRLALDNDDLHVEIDKLCHDLAASRAAGYQAAARDATDLLTGHGPDGEMIVRFLQQRGAELHEFTAAAEV